MAYWRTTSASRVPILKAKAGEAVNKRTERFLGQAPLLTIGASFIRPEKAEQLDEKMVKLGDLKNRLKSAME